MQQDSCCILMGLLPHISPSLSCGKRLLFRQLYGNIASKRNIKKSLQQYTFYIQKIR